MAGRALKLVVVDDSLAIQRSLGRLLASIEGVDLVGFAEDVTGAERLIDATTPDVVILDVALRDNGEGMDVLHHIRRLQPQVQVLIMSNTASPRIRERYLGAGALAYFDKASEFMRARDWVAAQVGHPGPDLSGKAR